VRSVETISAELKVVGLLYGERYDSPAIVCGKRSERGVVGTRVECGVSTIVSRRKQNMHLEEGGRLCADTKFGLLGNCLNKGGTR
jgi:hypothetical protein